MSYLRTRGRANVLAVPARSIRGPMLAVAVARVLLGAVALTLAPALYRDHFVVLVLLRPTKEVLLAAGFFVRAGDVGLGPVVLASLPLLLAGVWVFYVLGAGYSDEIEHADLPGLAGRLLPPARIAAMSEVLGHKGPRLVTLGRLAAFPSSLLAAAAGSAQLGARRFVVADSIGALLSLAEVIGAGYLLGEAHERAGPWLTVGGLVVLVALAVAFGSWLKRGEDGPRGGGAPPRR